jgi:prepilin signal peptidase PulO-like enzyme (type II secretory pathway)
MIAAADARRRLIPDEWLWPLLLAGLYLFGGEGDHIAAAILGYAIGFAMMRALRGKEALGYGDVKLMAAAGLWLGINGLSFAVVCACILGIAWGLWKKQRYVPFAPFLFMGAAANYLVMSYQL